MKKYWLVFKLTLQDYFVYRLNFILWRFRSFIFFLTLVFFWQAIYTSKETLFGYNQSQMLAYVIGVAFLRGVVLSSRSFDDLPGAIVQSHLSQWLIKPIDVFRYFFSRDLAAKALDIIFVVFEIFLLVKLLGLDFYVPHQLSAYLLFFLVVALSVLLYFLIGTLSSCLAFWIEEVWAPRWLFGIVFLEFMAGVYFPLDVLPKVLTNIFSLTPFPYLIYFPLKIWNQTVGLGESFKIMGILSFWIVLIWYLRNKVWQRGLKRYAAAGN
ncbi:ABC-2 family transporter protein [Candidatus Shapirobacteria bacterium]|nr:ABC-2 family transporter protein [Candidatus Shapirobacteria bacterium]